MFKDRGVRLLWRGEIWCMDGSGHESVISMLISPRTRGDDFECGEFLSMSVGSMRNRGGYVLAAGRAVTLPAGPVAVCL